MHCLLPLGLQVGLHLAYLIDVLCPPLANNKAKQATSAEEARVTKMLMHMAERCAASRPAGRKH